MKTTLETLRQNKVAKKPSVGVSCYTAPDAAIAEAAGVDFIVVGDSLAMTLLGFKSTLPATMAEMNLFTTAVWRGMSEEKRCLIIGDMPLGSYQPSDRDAVLNACELIRHGADLVKIEGCMLDRIDALADAGVRVVAHLGLQPQMKALVGGWKVQGKTVPEAVELLKNVCDVIVAGASVVLLEAVPTEVATWITDEANRAAPEVPILGIGCGPGVDGQLLVLSDLVGEFMQFKSRFAKRYVEAGKLKQRGIEQYVEEVRERKFPDANTSYNMDPEALARLKAVT